MLSLWCGIHRCVHVPKVLPAKGFPVTNGHRGGSTWCTLALLHHLICFWVLGTEQTQEVLCPEGHVAALRAPCNALQIPPKGCPKVPCLPRPHRLHVSEFGLLALLIEPHLVLNIVRPSPHRAAPSCCQPTFQGCAVDHAHEHCTSRVHAQLGGRGLHALTQQSRTETRCPFLVFAQPVCIIISSCRVILLPAQPEEGVATGATGGPTLVAWGCGGRALLGVLGHTQGELEGGVVRLNYLVQHRHLVQ